MGIILTILAFNFIIIIHEFGHFLIARLNGIKVLEFSLFVGPKLWSTKKGDTEYSLRLIPVLAYVKMEGEEESSDDENAFSNKSVWARMAVVAGGPFANLLSALVILLLIFSKTGYQTTKISEVLDKSPAYNAGLQVGDEIISYDNKRVYLPSDLIQFFYVDNGKKVDLTVLRDGQKKNVSISPYVISDDRYVLGFEAKDLAGEGSTIVKSVTSGYPASVAGIVPRDKLIALNDVKVSDIYDILEYTKDNQDKPIEVTILRDNQEMKLLLTPKLVKDQPSVNIGVAFSEHKGSLLEVLRHSTKYVWANVRNVGYSLKWLVSGQVSIKKMSGPVGIVTTMNDAANLSQTFQEKILNLLSMTAFISVAIGATNLVPFPALDGSKLLLLMIEAVTKKPIPPEKEARISMIGLTVLMILMLVTTSNDIIRIIDRIR